METNVVHQGDCLEVMADFPDNSIDTILTDPPYGLKFMGKNWDHGIPGVSFWTEMLRVAKPGATLMAFGSTRTHHRLMVAIEDAGWEIRDCISHFHSSDEREMALLDSMNEDQVQAYLELHYPNEMLSWVYGAGFPKAKRISESANHLVLKVDSCQCGENKCSIENTYPLQSVLDRICKVGILELMEHDVYSNEYYGMNISQDFQGDYHSLPHSCDEFLRQVVAHALIFLQPQEYVQEHNHSFGNEDDRVSLSLHTLCRVLYNDLHANRDYFHPLKIENVLQSLQEYEDENIPLSDLHALLNKLEGSLNVLRLMDDDKEVHRNIHIYSLVFCLPLSVLYILNSKKYATIIPQIVLCTKCGKLCNIWDGWTSIGLKPAWEPIIVAMKPIEKNYAYNAEKWGVSGLNIDDGRVGTNGESIGIRSSGGFTSKSNIYNNSDIYKLNLVDYDITEGRFPANLILSHSSLTVYKPKTIIPMEVKKIIVRYYNGYNKVRVLREDNNVQQLEGEEGTPEVLQRSLCRGSEEGSQNKDLCNDSMPSMSKGLQDSKILSSAEQKEVLRQNVSNQVPEDNTRGKASEIRNQAHRRVQTKDVGEHEDQRVDRRKTSQVEGRAIYTPRVSGRDDSLSDGEPAPDGTTDGEGGLYPGTSDSSSDDVETSVDSKGAGSSCQREQVGQQPGESTSVSDRDAFPKTQGDRSRIEQVEEREFAVEERIRTLEVFARDVPGWLIEYFEDTGRNAGCVLKGVKRVKPSNGSGIVGDTANSPMTRNTYGKYEGIQQRGFTHLDADGKEEVEDWECEPDCAVRLLDEGSGALTSGARNGQKRKRISFGENGTFAQTDGNTGYYRNSSQGGASRFFKNFPPARFVYSGKASRKERGEGNTHPTVKSLKVVEYLCTLTKTPTGGIVLDPFAGSGTVALAAIATDRPYILIEKEAEYVEIAKQRIAGYTAETIYPSEAEEEAGQLTLW